MSAALLTEDDGDDVGAGRQQPQTDVPAGLTGNSDIPRQLQQPAAGEDDYQIIETDDAFQPLSGPLAQPQTEIRSDEPAQPSTRVHLSGAQRRKLQRDNARASEARMEQIAAENTRLRQEMEELKGLGSRVERLDQGRFQDQIAGLTHQIDQAAQAVLSAQTRMSEAIMAADATAHTTALQDYTKALQRGNELAAQRTQLEGSRQTAEQSRQTQVRTEPETPASAPPRMDPLVAQRAQEFSETLPLLNIRRGPDGIARGADRDSRIALAIDQEIAAEGYDPRDDDYWTEYEDRLKESLPHWFDASQRPPGQTRQQPAPQQRQIQQVPPQRRGPLVAGAGGGNSQSGSRQVLLSPERKTALVQAGVLDYDGKTIVNRDKFNRLAAGFAKHDRDNGIGTRN